MEIDIKLSTPFGLKSAKLLVDIDVKMIKIASGELNNHELIAYFSKKHIPIILSTGFSTLSEISQTVELIKSEKCPFAILHCNASYPTPIEDLNLVNIQHLKTIFNTTIGFSDHSIGNTLPISSIALGACVVEKHFTLDSKKIGMDNQMATEPDDMQKLTSECLIAFNSLGTEKRILSKQEFNQRKKMRRSIFTRQSLKRNEKITLEKILLRRPGSGISPNKVVRILGKKVNKNINKNSLLKMSDVII